MDNFTLTHTIGGRVGARDGLGAVDKWKSCIFQELNSGQASK
jgi:hypothetical protein